MMDTTVKPGDHLKRFSRLQRIKNKIKNFFAALCGFITLLIVYPLWLVFFVPISMAFTVGLEAAHRQPMCPKIITVPLAFMLGLILDICFIPLALCGTACFIFAVIIGIITLFCQWVARIVSGR